MSIRHILYIALGIMLTLLMVSVYAGYQQSEVTIRHLNSFTKADESTLKKIRHASSLMQVADHNFKLLTIPPDLSPNDIEIIIDQLSWLVEKTTLSTEERQLFVGHIRVLRSQLDRFLLLRDATRRNAMIPAFYLDIDNFQAQLLSVHQNLGDGESAENTRSQLETMNNLLTELELQIQAFNEQNLFDPQRVLIPLSGAKAEINALLRVVRDAVSKSAQAKNGNNSGLAVPDRIAYIASVDESFELKLEILLNNFDRLILAINYYIDELNQFDNSAGYQFRSIELVAELESLVGTQLNQITSELELNIGQSKQALITSSINRQHFFFVLSMFSILISVLIAFYLSNLITSSIATLQQAAREFSAGNLKFRVENPETTEFIEVAEVLNQMADSVQLDQVRLRQNLAKLNEINRHLDARVESRTQDLENAMLHATRANQAKSQFLSSMSHELRTPLNAILGFSQLFKYDSNLTDKQKNNAQKINQAGAHLLTLVDEVLDLSRIETGDFELNIEPIPIVDILTEAVAWVKKDASARGIKISFDPDAYRDLLVFADPLRLKQIALNLLSNAVKYNCDNGKVDILFRLDHGSRLAIGFKDTGNGIPDHLLAELFQPFNRLGAETSAVEGTGIGLVISQKLVRAMGGSIKVESTPGQGTTFWIDFPLAKTAVLPDRPELTNTQEAVTVIIAGEKCRILVAEDKPINRELMAAQLEFLGYSADFAENGAEALTLLQEKKYQLLLTDIRMPVMDGLELCRKIRLQETSGSVPFPVIAVTANAMHSEANDCYEAGINAIITKPVIIDDLRKHLLKWLSVEHQAGV